MLRVSVSGLPVCEFPLWPKPPLVARHPKERNPKIGRLGTCFGAVGVPSLPILGPLGQAGLKIRKTRKINGPRNKFRAFRLPALLPGRAPKPDD